MLIFKGAILGFLKRAKVPIPRGFQEKVMEVLLRSRKCQTNSRERLVVEMVKMTPLKIKMEPENLLFEKGNHLPNDHFWGSTLIFRGVESNYIRSDKIFPVLRRCFEWGLGILLGPMHIAYIA